MLQNCQARHTLLVLSLNLESLETRDQKLVPQSLSLLFGFVGIDVAVSCQFIQEEADILVQLLDLAALIEFIPDFQSARLLCRGLIFTRNLLGCTPIQKPERQVHLLEPLNQIQLILSPSLSIFVVALAANDLLEKTTFLVDVDSSEAGQVSQLNERQLPPLVQGV